ncbi:5'/3'-nucleotidase SurE [Streptomyces sp. ODS28]|uniref:5'/3'-nucleotidase SurE n=1 Tax=Streptomyces sp. ODS28 TaxID=3136688 RepID=UPI0031E65388
MRFNGCSYAVRRGAVRRAVVRRPGARPVRRGAALAAGTAVLALLAGSAVADSPSAAGRPSSREGHGHAKLRILVSNDDGYRHPYIRQLRDALRRYGHEVVIVAPETDQSGRGTGLNFERGATVRASEAEPGVWSVAGSPGDAVGFGAQYAFGGRSPDLVVSGVNAGPNSGSLVNHSGTVGATVAAGDLDIPAVAVSAGMDLGNPKDPFPSAQRAASFAARAVERLADTARGGPLLPRGTSLNINLPARPDGGVAFTNVGRAAEVTRRFVREPGGCASCYKVELGVAPSAPERVPSADTVALRRGDAALSLLSADWGVRGWAPRDPAPAPSPGEAQKVRARLLGLHP